jgi:hypothetical protein
MGVHVLRAARRSGAEDASWCDRVPSVDRRPDKLLRHQRHRWVVGYLEN